MNKIFIILIFLTVSVFSIADQICVSWNKIDLKPQNIDDTQLNKEELNKKFNNILNENYTNEYLKEIDFKYDKLEIQVGEIMPKQTYLLFLHISSKHKEESVALWVIANNQKEIFGKELIKGNIAFPGGVYVWKYKNADYYRIMFKAFGAFRSSSAYGDYYGWEVDLSNNISMPLYAITWPESPIKDWPQHPVFENGIFSLNIKMPTEYFLHGILGTDCVSIDYVGEGVEVLRKSAISVKVTIPSEPLIGKTKNVVSLIEKNYSQLVSQNQSFKDISCEELTYLLNKYPQRIKLIDTRSKEKNSVSRIKNSVLYEENNCSVYEEGKVLVFYSGIGVRSARFLKQFLDSETQKGNNPYLNSYNLNGGIMAWINNGEKVVNDDGDTTNISLEDEYRKYLPEKYKLVN